MKSWPLRKPVPDDGGFVRTVVIHDDMDIDICRNVRFDGIQKFSEFLGPMSAMQLTNHPVGFQLQRGE